MTQACKNCGREIVLDNTDNDPQLDIPADLWFSELARSRPLPGDFWRHADTGEPRSGFTLCPGTQRYTPGARYAEPA